MRRLLLAGTAVAAVFATATAHAAEQSPTIVKLMTTDIVVEPSGLDTRTVHIEIMATNEAAASEIGQTSLPYREAMQELEVVEAYTLKANGQRLPVSPNAIYTQQPQSAPQLQAFDDTRLKVIVFPSVASGDTVIYTAKWRDKVPTIPGHFTHIEFFNRSVAYNEVRGSITAPKSLPLKVENHDLGIEKQETATAVTYRWRYSAAATDTVEVPYVSQLDRWPRILVSSLANHDELGRTYAALLFPKETVTARIQALADQLTAGITDRRQQAQAIYEWVSKNIRYVAVDIGNGGIIPHEADVTLANGYGDCKDHVVLFAALLKAKGIVSEVALINLGSTYSMPEVPMIYPFNHVITWLPEFGLYVDTTAGVAPFGILPFEEYGKPVVHAVASGRALRQTPVLPAGVASIALKTVARVDKNGKVTGESTVTAGGPSALRLRGLGLSIQATGPARFAAAALDGQGAKGTGTIDVPPPTDLGPSYALTSRFEYTDSDLLSGTGFEMIRGIWLTPVTGDTLVGSVFDSPQNDGEATACFSGRAEEELSLELPAEIPIGELHDDFRVKTANLEFSAKWSSSGSTVVVHREFTSAIDQPLCTGDVRKETAAALAQIRDHYESSTLVSYTVPQAVNQADQTIEEAIEAINRGEQDEAIRLLSLALATPDLRPESRPIAHSNRGVAYSRKGDNQQAIVDYSEAIRLKPDFKDAFNGRAAAFSSTRQYDRAVLDYSQAIRLAPEDANLYTRRAGAYFAQGKLDEATADYSAVIRMKPDEQIGYVNRAQVYQRSGLFDRSIRDCDSAIRLGRNTLDCFMVRGFANYMLARYDQAISNFGTAIEVQPENGGPYASRALVYLATNQLEQALSDFDSALTRRPDDPGALYGRAVAKEKRGDVAAAEADLASARRIRQDMVAYMSALGVLRDPYVSGRDDLALCQAAATKADLHQGSVYCSRAIAASSLDASAKVAAYMTLALIFRGKRYYEEVEQYLASASALDPSSPTVLVERGVTRGLQDDHDGAIRYFDQALRLRPSHGPAFLNRAIAYRFKGQFESALKDHNEAVRLDSTNGVFLLFRCQTLVMMGRAQEGLADCDKSVQLVPSDARAWDARAYAHLRLQNYPAAIRDYDSALLSSPNRAEALFGRGVAKAKSGATEGASADILEATRLDANIARKMSAVGIVPP